LLWLVGEKMVSEKEVGYWMLRLYGYIERGGFVLMIWTDRGGLFCFALCMYVFGRGWPGMEYLSTPYCGGN